MSAIDNGCVMTSPVMLPSACRMAYGSALTVDTMGTRRRVQHGGSINGISSHLPTVPGHSLVIAVNINVYDAPATAISADIARGRWRDARGRVSLARRGGRGTPR